MQVLITRWSIFDQKGQKRTVLSWSWRWNKNPGRLESDWPINQKLDRPNGDVALTLAKVDGPFKRELRDSERSKTQGSCDNTEFSNFQMVHVLLLWHMDHMIWSITLKFNDWTVHFSACEPFALHLTRIKFEWTSETRTGFKFASGSSI